MAPPVFPYKEYPLRISIKKWGRACGNIKNSWIVLDRYNINSRSVRITAKEMKVRALRTKINFFIFSLQTKIKKRRERFRLSTCNIDGAYNVYSQVKQ